MTRKRLLTKRRSFLFGMGAFTLTGGLLQMYNQMSAQGDKGRKFPVVGKFPLRDRAVTKGLLYGAAASYRRLTTDRDFAACFAQECNILVPEWELKWRTLRPSPDRFNFVPSNWLLKFARQYNMLFRGHTLVWHRDLPVWFADKIDRRNAEQMLRQHIAKVVGHFAGKVHSWDVVNEAIWTQDGRPDGLRKSPWLELLGSYYIEIAFRVAAEADPYALLVYNDYGLDYDTRDDEIKRVAVLKLLERLKSKGIPVHAFGMQAHLRGDETRFNAKKLKAFLRNIAELDLKILITEMDVTDQKLQRDANMRDRIVAEIYEDYLSVVLDEPAVIAVLTWGLSDKYTWLSKEKPRKDRAPVRPLPLDVQLNRKLAWNAIARAFDNAPQR
jgi:endo-1,4-beta-xylanase